LVAIVGLYLVLGLAYSIVNPILESPDEVLNYENIRFLAEACPTGRSRSLHLR